MTTLQPSAAKTSAVARPMPFEPPVISAVLPAIFRSMGAPGEARAGRRLCGVRTTPATGLLCRSDHAADSLAMADLRAKAEVARGGFDIDEPARGFRLRGVDIKLHRLPGRRAGRGDIVGRDALGMRHEV